MTKTSSNLTAMLSGNWEDGAAKNITFIVTKDCQLACKYCYLVGKNEKERMSFETAKKAVDYILSNRQMFPQRSVIWDFIGSSRIPGAFVKTARIEC